MHRIYDNDVQTSGRSLSWYITQKLEIQYKQHISNYLCASSLTFYRCVIAATFNINPQPVFIVFVYIHFFSWTLSVYSLRLISSIVSLDPPFSAICVCELFVWKQSFVYSTFHSPACFSSPSVTGSSAFMPGYIYKLFTIFVHRGCQSVAFAFGPR